MLQLLKTFVRTVYGLAFLVGGVVLLFWSFFSGLMLIICGVFLFKPTSQFIEKKRKLSRSLRIAIVIITGCLGVFGLAGKMVDSMDADKRQQAEEFATLPQRVKDSILGERKREQQVQAKQREKEEREAKINTLFSEWDGSNSAVTDYLKEKIDDPASYEHVKTTCGTYPDYVIVYTVFRCNNAFGAKIKHHIKAKVSLDNELLQVLELE